MEGWQFGRPMSLAREIVARILSVPVGWIIGGPQVSGAANLATLRRPFLVCPNHESHFDHPALRIALGPRYRDHLAIAAASDYFWKSRKRAFFAGWLGGFPFSRESHGPESLHTVEAFLRAGWSVLIYPEGTRTRSGRLGEFHAGPALVATRTGVDVLPVHIVGTRSVLPPGARWPHRARVQVRFGVPIRAKPGEDARGFNLRLADAIRDL